MKYSLSLGLLLFGGLLQAQNYIPLDSGKVGIGTKTPEALLHVYKGNVRVTNSAPYPYGIAVDMVGNIGTWAREFGISYNNTGKLAAFGVYAFNGTMSYAYIGGNTAKEVIYDTPWMVFKPDGNIGIGTLSTPTRFSVNGGFTMYSPVTTTDPRPPISAGTITGEIRGTSPAWYEGDNGFLRLSAGGGTAAGTKSFIDLSGYSNNQPDLNQNIVLGTSGVEKMRILSNGNVGIGTATPSVKLAVNGDIKARRIKITATEWPDYVFNTNYHLPDLLEVARFIDQHKHLPDVPSAGEIEKNGGVDIGNISEITIRKIEELTLYMIELKKENMQLKKRLEQLEAKQ
ncbi:hypothetical protein [Chitinophaga arvensicola]|uniref:Chaperone of endosialidase n=1 Tax=Chitinophaga arvensicola TaxID=29529 RepID=A0A1I0RB51_9BACT|nr:hypothetical protein [Chitinophaga arvensicola]SEW37860.1 hypothetical protein SAMN04488122_2553 [Chitinophaga arvensicola]